LSRTIFVLASMPNAQPASFFFSWPVLTCRRFASRRPRRCP
jgi:hypothetical protein